MAPSVYSGPMALAQSKHASLEHRKIVPAAVHPAITSPVFSTDETIATKAQVATTVKDAPLNMTLQNAGTQLALIQGNALKQDVEKHTARFSNTISNAVKNTRQLLEFLRDTMEKENAIDLKIVEHLWTDLEQLFIAAKETKTAIPVFLEKQRNNTSLYYASMMNETMQERQDELNIQNKKLNIQSSLILEQQEAFHDYKARVAKKLKNHEDLQEQASRLTLEKGHFRTELDKYKQLLAEERAANCKALQVGDSLREEHEALLTSKANLQIECDTLRLALSDLQEKKKNGEQQVVDRLTAELQAKVDELAKEAQKVTDLNDKILIIKGGEINDKMEAEKLKSENKAISGKYKMLTTEHAAAFTRLNEQMKKTEALTNEIESIKTEKIQMKSQLAESSGFRKEITELTQAKLTLLKQLENLSTELNTIREDNHLAKTEIHSLVQESKLLKNEVDALTTEKKESLSRRAEADRAMQALKILKNENSNLKTAMDELNSKNEIATPSGPPALDEEKKAQKEKIRILEEENKSLETAVQEWINLAKRSYNEYKEILPTYKRASHYRKEALDKESVIKSLKLELSASKTSQSNDSGATSDSIYWKDKYESLLASIGG